MNIYLRYWLGIAALAVCSGAAPSQQLLVPPAVTIGASGFATIERAPSSPLPDAAPPAENRPKDERGFYARMAGISDAEAAKRIAEQQRSRPQFEKLLATLRNREAGNFTDARMVHAPDWAYVFYFKRDPDRTLAKYTRHPHFKAGQAKYNTAQLQGIAQPWVEQFTRHRLLGGYGTDATYGEVRMDLNVSEAEFRTIAERERWKIPSPVKLAFSPGVQGQVVAPQLISMIRIFPQSDRDLGATNEALLGGRIVLRDGCFYVTSPGKPAHLAYFEREVALAEDEQGYLSLRTRGRSPRHLGRIGEQFSWGGPIGAPEDMPMVAELRKRCGNAPLEHVGVPESSRLFHVRPHVIDAIAERRRVSREEAWRRFKACLETRETSSRYLDCDTI